MLGFSDFSKPFFFFLMPPENRLVFLVFLRVARFIATYLLPEAKSVF
jgi:hypothetical protein